MRLLPLFVLMACEPMPPTGNPLAPVPAARPAASGPKTSGTPAPVASGTAPKATGDGFDFDEDAGPEDGSVDAEAMDAATLLALSQGKEPPRTAPKPAPAPAPAPAPVPSVAPMMAVAPLPMWDPATAVPADWGVRLVSTLVELQPPRAVLGLSDGSEVVVQPGTFLPEQRMVVMAVGRNAVQVSRVIPDGYQARVETHTISSLFPTQPVPVQ